MLKTPQTLAKRQRRKANRRNAADGAIAVANFHKQLDRREYRRRVNKERNRLRDIEIKAEAEKRAARKVSEETAAKFAVHRGSTDGFEIVE